MSPSKPTLIERTADLSTCGRYRWRLGRSWAEAPKVVLWVMLNPSTADAEVDDPTIRRCMSFAAGWDFGGIEVANLYAWRATKPADLATADDPVGFQNDFWLKTLAQRADMVVCAWGQRGPQPNRADQVIEILKVYAGSKLYSLGFRQDGGPRHPLYLASNTELQRWNP